MSSLAAANAILPESGLLSEFSQKSEREVIYSEPKILIKTQTTDLNACFFSCINNNNYDFVTMMYLANFVAIKVVPNGIILIL